MNTGKVNNINSVNGNQPIKRKEQEEKKRDTEFQHEVDYLNTPNPADMLGRSMVQRKSVSFSGTKAEPEETSIPKIVLKKNKPISKAESIEVLKFFGMTDEEIAMIDFEKEEVKKSLSNIKAYVESGIFKEEELEEIKNSLKEAPIEKKIEFAEELSGNEYYDYLNKETFDALSPYFEIDPENIMNLVEKLLSLEDKDIFFEKIPLIVDYSGKITKYNELGLSNVKGITKEKIDILKEINKHIDDDDKKLSVYQCDNLGNIEDLTPELITKYTQLLDKLKTIKGLYSKSLFPSWERLDIKTLTEKMSKAEAYLKEHPLNLENNSDSDILDLQNIVDFAERKDKKEIQEYINSLSPKAKSLGIKHMPDRDSALPKEKMAKICEILTEDDYGKFSEDKVFSFLDSQKENEYKDIDYITKIIKRAKGTDDLYYYTRETLSAPKGDYKTYFETLEVYDEIQKQGKNLPLWMIKEILKKEDLKPDQFYKILNYIKDNDVKISWYNLFDLSTQEKGYNKFLARRIYEKRGWNLENADEHTTKTRLQLDEIAEKAEDTKPLEFMERLFSHRKYPDSNDWSMRFKDYGDIYELAKLYMEKPEETEYIVNLKSSENSNKNSWRLSGSGLVPVLKKYLEDPATTMDVLNFKIDGKERFYGSEDLEAAIDAFKINKENAIYYSAQKRLSKSGHSSDYKFKGAGIKDLVESAEIDKEYTDKLLNDTIPNEYDRNQQIPRFQKPENIKFIIQKREKDKEFVENIVNCQYEYYGDSEYRFNEDQITNILNISDDLKDILMEYINKKQTTYDGSEKDAYTGYEIADIANDLNKDKELTIRLLDETYKHNNNDYKRFVVSDVTTIVNAAQKDKDFTEYLLKQKIKYSNGDDIPKYSSSWISALVDYSEKIGSNLVKDYLDIEKYPEENTPDLKRFEVNDINNLVEANLSDKDYTEKLLKKTFINKEGKIQYLYNSDDIKNIVCGPKCRHDLEEELYNNDKFPKALIADAIQNVNNENVDFIKRLCDEEDFPKNLIGDISRALKKENQELAEIICFDKDFDKEYISSILYYTNAKNIELAKQICSNLAIPEKHISNILQYCNSKETSNFISKLYNSEEFPNKFLAATAQYLRNSQDNLEKAEAMMSNPKLQNWVVQNLSNGLSYCDIDTLLKTQKRLYQEAEQVKNKKTKTKETQAKTESVQPDKTNEQTNAEAVLSDLGIDPRMAPAFIKRCSVNGKINEEQFNAICNLAKVGVPAQDIMKNIKDIFNFATGNQLSDLNGTFRPEFVDDIAKLFECGITDIKLASNISAVINMSVIEMKDRLNTKTRADMAERVKNLPEETKAKITENGYEIDAILEKALTEPKHGVKVKRGNIPQIKLRSLDSIVGTERVVINKFKNELKPEIWGNEEVFKKWAKDKLAQILDFEQNPNYTATGRFSAYNEVRKQGIESWYKFLTEESNHQNDIFAHLLVMDAITKEMKPNNAYTPPAVSHESFEATYNALLEENTKVSFSDLYSEQIRERAIKEYGEPIKTVDGIEGQWVCIPCSQRGEEGYDDRIAMVQALAKGSSWCLRFDNAHNYLQKGSLNFFIDKTGNSQTAINVLPNGVICEIEKRYNQNSTVPIALANVIEDWIAEKGYTGWEEKRQDALKAKPKFDEQRNKFRELQKQNDTESIFRELGINVEKLPDGTYKISKYNPIQDNMYSLTELGIDEDKLMENVSIITSGLNLNGSSLTAMPQLRKIEGNLTLGDSRISDLRNLEIINNHNIYWDKDE